MKQRGFGSVFCRGKIWWIKYYYRGAAKRESSHSLKEQDAVRLLRRRQGEIGQGRLTGPDVEKTTFEDLMQMIQDDYAVNGRRSVTRLQTSVKALSAFFAYSKAQNITLDIANEVALRNDVNQASGNFSAIITGRTPVGSIDPEQTNIATINFFNKLTTNAVGALTYVLGSTAGNITTVTAPKAQILNAAPGDRDALRTEALDLLLSQDTDAGDDELSIAFT